MVVSRICRARSPLRRDDFLHFNRMPVVSNPEFPRVDPVDSAHIDLPRGIDADDRGAVGSRTARRPNGRCIVVAEHRIFGWEHPPQRRHPRGSMSDRQPSVSKYPVWQPILLTFGQISDTSGQIHLLPEGRQSGPALYRSGVATGAVRHVSRVTNAIVWFRVMLEITPNSLHNFQVRRVGRQIVDEDCAALLLQVARTTA